MDLPSSDEAASICGDFNCTNRRTISLTSLCNNIQECGDDSDEKPSLCGQCGNITPCPDSMYEIECERKNDLEYAKWNADQESCKNFNGSSEYWNCNGKCIPLDYPCDDKC